MENPHDYGNLRVYIYIHVYMHVFVYILRASYIYFSKSQPGSPLKTH